MYLERAIEENGAALVDEELVVHTGWALRNSVEARIIIIYRDIDGTEWEFNDTRFFCLKRKQ